MSKNTIPVTVIGGYLGSGKTTLVNHLLRHANGRRLAIMVNEFGELPIDADLIEAEDDDIISLAGGCVCCSYGNDLIMAMMEMTKLETPPDHIVLESSGVALPGAIVSSISLLEGYSIDGVVVLADAETVREKANDKYMSDTVLRQFEDADIVLLNKTDLVTADELNDTTNWLATVAKNAVVVETNHSKVPLEVALQDFDRQVKFELRASAHQTNHFTSEVMSMDEPVDLAVFAQSLIDGHPNLVRAKGFAKNFEGEVQALQLVGKRFEILPARCEQTLGIVTIFSKSG